MKIRLYCAFFGFIAAGVLFVALYQWYRYKQAVESVVKVQRMIPGKTRMEEVKESIGKNFSRSANCSNDECTFDRKFDHTWLELLILKRSSILSLYVLVKGGVVTETYVSMKVVRPDYWVGVAVRRSPQTTCLNPGSSCTSVISSSDLRIPTRVMPNLTAEPSSEVVEVAYNFNLKCLSPLYGCSTIDEIYPNWRRLPNLPPLVAKSHQ